MLQNLIPYLTYHYQKLSKFAVAGLAIIICSVVIYTHNITYKIKKLEQVKLDIVAMKKNYNLMKQQELQKKQLTEVDGILNFHKKTELPDIFEFIHTTAKNNNINMFSVDYKITKMPLINLVSYEVTFPATGGYKNFMAFITQIEQKNDGVILKRIELSRDSEQVNMLDGLLQIAIYAKS